MATPLSSPSAEAMRTSFRGALVRLMLMLMMGALSCAVPRAHAQQTSVLLRETFEGTFKNDPFCREGGCEVPEGWGVWFTPRAEGDKPGINERPTFDRWNVAPREGSAAQRIRARYATFSGGLYRVVTGVQPGARLRFTAWARAWSTNDDSPISARPSGELKVSIGIDPVGGNGTPSPLSGQVVRAPEQSPLDRWVQLTVEVEARSESVVLFTYASMKDPVRNNEVYWDDFTLEVLLPEPTPTPGAAGSDAAPAATSMPEPPTVDITHTVKPGETLSGIALEYGTTVDELLRNNPGVRPELLQIGTVLVIRRAAVTPTPTAAPAAPEAPASAPLQIVVGTPTVGELCLQAFFDDDGNGQRDEGEDLVPSVLFKVRADAGLIAQYSSTGVDEPFCLQNLPNDTYVVEATVLDVYVTTTPRSDTLTINGNRAMFSLGIRRRDDTTKTSQRQPTSQNPVFALLTQRIVLEVIGGALIVFGATGVIGAGLRLLSRRRRL